MVEFTKLYRNMDRYRYINISSQKFSGIISSWYQVKKFYFVFFGIGLSTFAYPILYAKDSGLWLNIYGILTLAWWNVATVFIHKVLSGKQWVASHLKYGILYATNNLEPIIENVQVLVSLQYIQDSLVTLTLMPVFLFLRSI